MLVDKLAEAGMGWSPDQGSDDALYKKIESIVQRIQLEFVDQIEMFVIELADLEEFLSDEDKQAEVRIEASADEVHRRDQAEIARIVATAEIDLRIGEATAQGGVAPREYLVKFLRERWVTPLGNVWLREGENSAMWRHILDTLDDLLWSVQPKRTPEDRRKLVKLLPGLLQRLYSSLQDIEWTNEERQAFLDQLVDSHACAVKASLVTPPDAAGAAVAERLAEPPTQPLDAAGEAGTAAAQPLAPAAFYSPMPAAMSPAQAAESQDEALALVRGLTRGVWVEFSHEDGSLVSSRLAWVSPLRGNYLFTNRQGRRAFTLSRDELAQRFRDDEARLVEAQPLLDRALSNMMSSLSQPAAPLVPSAG
jgi:hypothetical protein